MEKPVTLGYYLCPGCGIPNNINFNRLEPNELTNYCSTCGAAVAVPRDIVIQQYLKEYEQWETEECLKEQEEVLRFIHRFESEKGSGTIVLNINHLLECVIEKPNHRQLIDLATLTKLCNCSANLQRRKK